jgi:tRNA/rRNA methyltransferase
MDTADLAVAPDILPPAVVLVRPQLGENIGMSARAMANFGLRDLRLVAPRDGWPNPRALDAAVGAAEICETARVFATLEQAVADCVRSYATTARQRGQAKPVLGLPACVAEVLPLGAAGQRTALIFGPERTGLANEEVAVADALLSFAVSPRLPSLNLAQAVSLAAHGWFTAAHGADAPFGMTMETPPASRAAVLGLFEHLEGALDRAGYFIPEGKRALMALNLRNILQRIGMTEQDVRTLRGVVVALERGRLARGKTADAPAGTGSAHVGEAHAENEGEHGRVGGGGKQRHP